MKTPKKSSFISGYLLYFSLVENNCYYYNNNVFFLTYILPFQLYSGAWILFFTWRLHLAELRSNFLIKMMFFLHTFMI